MSKVKQGTIKELKFDPQNANKGTERGNQALEESLQRYGAGRSVLADKNGVIIAGNKTVEKAGELGIEDAVFVPTRGGPTSCRRPRRPGPNHGPRSAGDGYRR